MQKINKEQKVWEGVKLPSPFANDIFFGELILEKLKETPNRVCQISVDDNSELSCDELRIKSIRVAQNLRKIGIQSGDVVGLICRHSHAVTIALYGCVLIGAPVNPLDFSFTMNDVKHLFSQTNPKIVICDSDQVTKIREALSELKNDARIYSLPNNSNNQSELNFQELLAATGEEEEFVAPKFDQSSEEKILTLLYSSGTTGLPKGVMVSHSVCISWSLTPLSSTQTRSLCFGNIYSGSGFSSTLLVPFRFNDTRLLTREGFSVEKLKEIISKYKATDMLISPMNMSLILQSDFPQTVDHECLTTIFCVGSIVSVNLRKKFEDVFLKKSLIVAYAMSEKGAICMTVPNDFKDNLCVGSVLPNLIIKIVDEDGHKLGVNDPGEICFKSNIKFLGYYNNPEATKNAIDDEGFFKSGDVGYFDENGKLHVIDRKKEIVKCLSKQVCLSEIENVIESIEGVQFVSVIGIPDPLYDTLPAAAVVKRSGFESLTEKLIADFVASKLSVHKHLRGGVHFIDQLPMTPSGKIRKTFVSEIVMNKLNK